jgi:hypothetical protein
MVTANTEGAVDTEGTVITMVTANTEGTVDIEGTVITMVTANTENAVNAENAAITEVLRAYKPYDLCTPPCLEHPDHRYIYYIRYCGQNFIQVMHYLGHGRIHFTCR